MGMQIKLLLLLLGDCLKVVFVYTVYELLIHSYIYLSFVKTVAGSIDRDQRKLNIHGTRVRLSLAPTN